MELRDGMFAVKLEELDRQYGRLQSRLEQCRSADHQRVREINDEKTSIAGRLEELYARWEELAEEA